MEKQAGDPPRGDTPDKPKPQEHKVKCAYHGWVYAIYKYGEWSCGYCII